MINSSGNLISLRDYSPFRVISRFLKGPCSVSPSSVPFRESEESVEAVGLNVLNRTGSFDELENLNSPLEKIKPSPFSIETSDDCLFLPVTNSSCSSSPYSIISNASLKRKDSSLKRSVSFNEVVEALSITNLYEPSREEIRKHIETEWDKGNLFVTKEIARKVLIQERIKSKIVKIRLLD